MKCKTLQKPQHTYYIYFTHFGHVSDTFSIVAALRYPSVTESLFTSVLQTLAPIQLRPCARSSPSTVCTVRPRLRWRWHPGGFHSKAMITLPWAPFLMVLYLRPEDADARPQGFVDEHL